MHEEVGSLKGTKKSIHIELIFLYVIVTSHVPCLPCDFDRVTQDFKSILNDIFDPKTTATDEPLPLNVTDFTSSVSVNGPLNVQQYYELSGKPPPLLYREYLD
jgi:hypothetical protein